jgi:HlyD family secretion protein
MVLSACSQADESQVSLGELVAVERGPMAVRLIEAGELKAATQTIITSEVESRCTIISMVEEGAEVKKGDKLVELDASNLVDRKARREINLARSKARLVQAEQSLGILEKEIIASEETAESKLKIAEMELEKFLGRLSDPEETGIKATNEEMLVQLRELVDDEKLESMVQELEGDLVETVEQDLLQHVTGNYRAAEFGKMAQDIVSQIDQVRLMQADLKIKEEEWRQSEKLFEKKFVNRSDLEADQYEYQSQLSKVTLALNKLELLINYELKKEKIQLAQDYSNANLDLEKISAANLAKKVRETANLNSRRAEYELAEERFKNLLYQIEHAVIYAPTDGLVVYYNKGSMHRRETIEEGSEVYHRQALMILPDVSRMVATIRVQEADVDKIKPGQIAEIQLDAFKELTFTGQVRQVAPLPDSKSRYQNKDLKVYMTDILLDGENEILRPGMSATVIVHLDDLDEVLQVPIGAVNVQGVVNYVWLMTPDGPEARIVHTGAVTLEHIQLLDGVEDGDQLLMSEPEGFTAPEFQQPEQVKPATEAEMEATKRQQDREGLDAAGGSGIAGRMRAALLEKFPDHPALQQAQGWMRALGDPAIQAAMESDPDLKALRDEWAASMGNMFDNDRRDRRRGGRDRGRSRGRGRE